MPKPIIRIFACCVALALFQKAQAAGPVGKLFGGFEPGTKFTFRVTKITSTRSILSGAFLKNVPIPKNLPKFEKGRAFHFSIGKKGQLKGPGFSFHLNNRLPGLNYYLHPRGALNGGGAIIYKSSASQPSSATVTFREYPDDGYLYSVVYTLK